LLMLASQCTRRMTICPSRESLFLFSLMFSVFAACSDALTLAFETERARFSSSSSLILA
jgi:hypothetical protein